MQHCPAALLGARDPVPPRFPLLIKIIDAHDTLSLQVHPPAAVAERLGGQAKTEMWYVARAEPGAELFVGLKKGVTRANFERKLAHQTVAECFHRIAVREGDAMFLPSGRVHALGAGTVIFEVQQNSDTTYRVFDWNRLDRDGKARELHVPQSLASIDFGDFELSLVAAHGYRRPSGHDPSAGERRTVYGRSQTMGRRRPTDLVGGADADSRSAGGCVTHRRHGRKRGNRRGAILPRPCTMRGNLGVGLRRGVILGGAVNIWART